MPQESGPTPRPNELPRDEASSVPWSAEPPHSGGDAVQITISQFQALIRAKYHATDAARGVPGTFMWLIEEVGELATALQDNAAGKSPTPAQRANLEEEFADVLAWLMTLANIAGADQKGIDMQRALEKYTKAGRVEGVKD